MDRTAIRQHQLDEHATVMQVMTQLQKETRRPFYLAGVPVAILATLLVVVHYPVGGADGRIMLAAGLALYYAAIGMGYANARRATAQRRAELALVRGNVTVPCPICDARTARSVFLQHLATLHPETARDAKAFRWTSGGSFLILLVVAVVGTPLVALEDFPSVAWTFLVAFFFGGFVVWAAFVFLLGGFVLPRREDRARAVWNERHRVQS